MNPQVYLPLSFLPLSSLVLTVRSMLMFHCCQSKALIMTINSTHLHSSSICLCFVVYGFPTLTLFCSYLCFACVCFPPHSWTLWPLPACQIELGTVGKVTPVLQNTPPGGWWPHWHTHRPEEKKNVFISACTVCSFDFTALPPYAARNWMWGLLWYKGETILVQLWVPGRGSWSRSGPHMGSWYVNQFPVRRFVWISVILWRYTLTKRLYTVGTTV